MRAETRNALGKTTTLEDAATPAEAGKTAPKEAGPKAADPKGSAPKAAAAPAPGAEKPAPPATPAPAPKGPPAKPAAAKPAPPPQAAPAPAPPTASAVKFRLRHLMVFLSFVLLVLAPLGTAGWYLYTVADDQYASHVGFSVRKEEVGSAVDILGGITNLSGSSSSDTDILYEFIQSQQMVRIIDQRLDLKKIYHNPDDPVFGLGEDERIEALSAYWGRMVKVFYDSGSGLIEIRVLSFDPGNSLAIAQAVFEESSRMINDLSAIAREDATRYAREELDRGVERLKKANAAMTAFRSRTRIVDPLADIQGQMGLLNSLQEQLAGKQIELAEYLEQGLTDRRVDDAQRSIKVIRKLIEDERNQIGSASGDNAAYSDLLEEYEGLAVDQQFAEKSYLSAQAAYEVALAEAQRQSRYLASYIEPTRAETAEYPQRLILMVMLGGFLFVGWSILVMIYYSLRDRR